MAEQVNYFVTFLLVLVLRPTAVISSCTY